MSLTKVTSNVINDVDASKLTGSIADARKGRFMGWH